MKRIVTILLLILLGTASLMLPVAADSSEDWYQEQVEASGAEDLFLALPQETRDLLATFGITDLELERYTTLQPKKFLQTLLSLFGEQVGSVTAVCGVLLGVVVLGAFAESLRQFIQNDGMGSMLMRMCAIATCGGLFLPLSQCIQQTSEAVEGVRVLMFSFIPTYAAVILASGQTTLAASYSTVLLTGAECITMLVSSVSLPLLTVSLGLGAAGTLSQKNRLSGLSGSLAKTAMWILGTTTGLFTGLLSMQSFVAASADSLGLRAAKMSLSSFVPIVGGALSEAFGTVTGCVKLLRSTMGMFGVLATAALVLPSFFRCLAYSLALSVCRVASEAMGVETVTGLIGTVQTVVKVLMGILAACALFLIISTTLVATVGRT